MDDYRIAEVAALVGVPATTLRYYEDIGLIRKPARDYNGYRRYNDSDVVRLRFVANAKNLGIPLGDVKQLVVAFDAEDCSTVAHQVVETVAARAAQTRAQIHQLTTLATQLQAVAARLVDAPSGQLCDDGCPCATVTLEGLAQSPRTTLPVLAATPAVEAPIACTLDAGAVADRVGRWRALTSAAVRREDVLEGVALVFVNDEDLAAQVAALASAEQACCSFFDFTIRITHGELRLELRAPADAADSIALLLDVSTVPSA